LSSGMCYSERILKTLFLDCNRSYARSAPTGFAAPDARRGNFSVFSPIVLRE
jgi:hypothetical protein